MMCYSCGGAGTSLTTVMYYTVLYSSNLGSVYKSRLPSNLLAHYYSSPGVCHKPNLSLFFALFPAHPILPPLPSLALPAYWVTLFSISLLPSLPTLSKPFAIRLQLTILHQRVPSSFCSHTKLHHRRLTSSRDIIVTNPIKPNESEPWYLPPSLLLNSPVSLLPTSQNLVLLHPFINISDPLLYLAMVRGTGTNSSLTFASTADTPSSPTSISPSLEYTAASSSGRAMTNSSNASSILSHQQPQTPVEDDTDSCSLDPDAWFAQFHDQEIDLVQVSDELPTRSELERAANIPVLDSDGTSRPFQSLFTGDEHIGQRQLIIFVRHFYCAVCFLGKVANLDATAANQ